MNNRQLRKKAAELIRSGKSHQRTFEELKEQHSGMDSQRIAETLAYIPSLYLRKKYAGLNVALFVCLIGQLFFKIYFKIPVDLMDNHNALHIITIAYSIAAILFIINVWNYNAKNYLMIGIINSLLVIKLFNFYQLFFHKAFVPIDITLSLSIIIISFCLYKRFKTPFVVHTEECINHAGEKRMKRVIVFEELVPLKG